MTVSEQTEYLDILRKTLEYSRKRDYVGWDKHDGMSSRIRQLLPFEYPWINLGFQETIKRAPINVRPLFLVEQRPSPKGLSLFTMANLNCYEITNNTDYLSEAQSLANRVTSHNLDEYDGFCLYHNHELQGLSSKTPIETPDIVSTSFGVKALLRSAEIDEAYPELARSAPEYIESELYPVQDGDQIRISYKPTRDTDTYTLNANALAARVYTDLYECFENEEYRDIATSILNYVASRQEDIGGWKYRDPPDASHLSMDNYHNGFIIESFLRYQEVVDQTAYSETIEDALKFYRNVLYDEDGAPCWDETSSYPRDTHAAAQGIIVFTLSGDFEFAKQIIDWTVENLYSEDGEFYYQDKRLYTKTFTLMRWCQAWMAYGISEYLSRNNTLP